GIRDATVTGVQRCAVPIPSDDQLAPPIPAVLQGFVRRGQLGYQRMDVAGRPYLVMAGKVPGSNAQLYLFFPEQSIQRNLAQLRRPEGRGVRAGCSLMWQVA